MPTKKLPVSIGTKMIDKPAKLGYRMPAEWEPHAATWLTWPHNPNYWSDIREMKSLYVTIIRALAEGESVDLLVNNESLAVLVEAILRRENLDRVKVHIIPTNDIWIRDYGPNFLVGGLEGKVVCNHWVFNSWGGKYDMQDDSRTVQTLAERLGWTIFNPGIVMEGGAIEVNGKGTCITTKQCLLNENRNTGLSRTDLERFLKDYLGVGKIIWCRGGIQGDDTDGHVDNLVRFVNSDTVLCAWEEDTSDYNHVNLKENYEILKRSTDQDGKPLNVIPLPMPGYVGNGKARWPASYANFYLGNRVVLVPGYNHPNDQEAVGLLEKFFPDRRVISIPSQTLITGQGGIHCITQQQPEPFTALS